MGIKDDMKLLARHEGEWEGEYIHVGVDGEVIDRHRSQLSCRFPTDDPDHAYRQINTYTWDDGREEVIDFPASYDDGQIWFDTERIRGHAWEVDANTIVLTWVYKAQPDVYLYEMIQLSHDGVNRARTWHWFDNDRLVRRTLINERRTSPPPD